MNAHVVWRVVCVGWVGCAATVAQEIASPVFVPGPASSAVGYQVAVSCVTQGAEIHFTTNGEEPTIFDPSLGSGGSIFIQRNTTLKAKAWLGGESSTVTSGDFDVTGDISAGSNHMLALKSSGWAYAWGEQSNGRLGNGNAFAQNITSPVRVRKSGVGEYNDAVAMSAGVTHSVWLDKAGQVWASGQGTTSEQGFAMKVLKSATAGDFLTNCVDLGAGQDFSAALASNGQVYAWGLCANGRLGDGSTSGTRLFADKVRSDLAGNPVLQGIAGIELGDTFALAREQNALEQVGSNGYVWAWGENANGQLGVGSLAEKTFATRVKLDATRDLTDAWDVSAGDTHAAIVRWKTGDPNLQGTVWTMGSRANGRLGNKGSTVGSQSYPVQVVKEDGTPLKNIIQVSAGSSHTLALDSSGHVWAWGNNSTGALGDGTITSRTYAVQVRNQANNGWLSNIVRITAGGATTLNFSAAVGRDGTIYTWGRNADGQLGIGTSGTGANRLPRVVTTLKATVNSPDVVISPSVIEPVDPGRSTLIATPSDPDGLANILKVDFYSQGQWVGSATQAPWSIELQDLSSAEYYNYAIVTDCNGHTGMSPSARFTIQVNPDADADGLLDAWEMQWFGHLNASAGGDEDGDHISNAVERNLGTNPASCADSDGDGLPDDWEAFWFGGLSQLGGDDPDQDHVSNTNEFSILTNPNSAGDDDQDGMADDWEIYHFASTESLGDADADGDKVSNSDEYVWHSNPRLAADNDHDGLPDDWEKFQFGDLSQRGVDDADDDRVSNAEEYALNTNPNVASDGDGDSMQDDWEMLHFGSIEMLAEADFDGDKISNGNEFAQGSNPKSAGDSDQDDLPDDWEVFWFGGRNAQAGSGDADGDGLSNFAEYLAGTEPMNFDTDGDYLSDGWEASNLLDPLSDSGVSGRTGDPDGDGIQNQYEFVLGFDPNNSATNGTNDGVRDRDGDGMPDGYEVLTGSFMWDFGLNHLVFTRRLDWEAPDGTTDLDGDGLTAIREYQVRSDPVKFDTDGDGLPDGFEDKSTHLDPLTVNNPNADSDSDGMSDLFEAIHGFDPDVNESSADPDGDGLSNTEEAAFGSDPTTADIDADGLNDFHERQLQTDPWRFDSDGDSLPDKWEIKYHFDPLVANNPDSDDDQDGLSLYLEYRNATNPSMADSDGDGTIDGAEVAAKTDPIDAEWGGSPPAAPSHVTTTANGDGSITYSWQDNSTNESGFHVYVLQADNTWKLVGSVPANVTSLTNP